MNHSEEDIADQQPHQPDLKTGEGRVWTLSFVNLWLVGLFSYAGVYLLLPILPVFLQAEGVAAFAIGTLIGLKGAAALLSRPFAGVMTDHFGRRPFIILGVLGLLVSTLALPFIADAVLLGVLFGLLRIVSGVGWGSLTATANTLAGELAPRSRRGEAIGLYTVAGSIALAISPPLGSFLSNTYGYTTAFWVACGLIFLALGCAFVVREPAQPPTSLPPLRASSLLFRPALKPAGILTLHFMTYGALVAFLPLLAQSRSLGTTGLFFTIYALILALLRAVTGRLSDRVGRPAIIMPGLLSGALAMLVLALASARWHMLVAAVLFSLAMALVQPPALAWGLDLGGEKQRGTAMATMVAAQDLGIALGGVSMGLVANIGGFGTIFSASATLAFLAAGLLLVWQPGVPSGRPKPYPSQPDL